MKLKFLPDTPYDMFEKVYSYKEKRNLNKKFIKDHFNKYFKKKCCIR